VSLVASNRGCINLGTESRRRETRGLEIFSKKRGQETAEKNLCTTGLGKASPEKNEELGSKVEWHPVCDAENRFENREECKNNPVGDPLVLVDLRKGEESTQAVVAWNDKTGQICQCLAPEVESNKEEIESTKTTNDISLGYTSLLLQIDQEGILAQLLIELRNVV